MEITLRLPEGDKVYKQTEVNFVTMKMALEWAEMKEKQMKAITDLMSKSIDEDVEEATEEYLDQFDPYESLQFTADLVVSFFAGQFTYDEFLNYAFFKNSVEYYELAQGIFDLAFATKEDVENEQTGKKKKRTS